MRYSTCQQDFWTMNSMTPPYKLLNNQENRDQSQQSHVWQHSTNSLDPNRKRMRCWDPAGSMNALKWQCTTLKSKSGMNLNCTILTLCVSKIVFFLSFRLFLLLFFQHVSLSIYTFTGSSWSNETLPNFCHLFQTMPWSKANWKVKA